MPEIEAIKVYVHLAHGFGPNVWAPLWDAGKIVGFMDRVPYGYNYAEHFGCRLTYSYDKAEGKLAKLWRGGVRILLGFDFVHAYRNRHRMAHVDVIWTHTESQYLAILALKALPGSTIKAKLIAQTVWLFDRWDTLSPIRRSFYRHLIKRADILTFHSPLNRAVAQTAFPQVATQVVYYGITSDVSKTARPRPSDKLQLLALGNDRHRDWKTLVEAVKVLNEVELTIASGKAPDSLVVGAPNVKIARPKSVDDIKDLYGRAEAIIVPLKLNRHASGITVVLEAAALSLPIVATDVGGLCDYFTEDDVIFLPPYDADAFRRAISRLRNMGPKGRAALGAKGRANIEKRQLSSRAFARQHAEISHQILGRPWIDSP